MLLTFRKKSSADGWCVCPFCHCPWIRDLPPPTHSCNVNLVLYLPCWPSDDKKQKTVLREIHFPSNVHHHTSSSLSGSLLGDGSKSSSRPKNVWLFLWLEVLFSFPFFSWKAGGVECRVHCIRYGVGFVRRSPDVSVVCVIFNHERSDDDGPLFSWLRKIILRVPSSSLFFSFIWCEIWILLLLIVIIWFTVMLLLLSLFFKSIGWIIHLRIYLLIGGVVSVFSTSPEPPVATGLVISWFERQLAPPSASAAPGRSARRLVPNRFPAASWPLSGQSWSARH